VLLLQALKTALSAQGKLLSVAVAASSISASISYDIPNVSANVDFINLMTYDLHSAWDSNTGINAPLFQGPESRSDLNVAACISYWLGQGAPAAKLIVGIPTYGISFTLANSANNGLGAAAIGAGTAGTFTKQPGFLGYYEICAAGWTRVPQSAQKVPYAFSGNQWVGYDDVESVSVKSNYIVSNNLGGSMFWSIETDDFRGNCGGGSFPLITASYNIIMNVRCKCESGIQLTTNFSHRALQYQQLLLPQPQQQKHQLQLLLSPQHLLPPQQKQQPQQQKHQIQLQQPLHHQLSYAEPSMATLEIQPIARSSISATTVSVINLLVLQDWSLTQLSTPAIGQAA